MIRRLGSHAARAARATSHRRAVRRAKAAIGVTRLEPASLSRPVYFFGIPRYPAYKLGGVYLAEGLRRMGIRACSAQRIEPAELTNSILVFVKGRIPEDLSRLKRNGNRIVIDMRDNYNLPNGALDPDFVGRDVADVLIFPNRALLDRFLSLGPTSSACAVLYGFADPAITASFRRRPPEPHGALRCCYFGQLDHLDADSSTAFTGRPYISCIPSGGEDFERQVGELRGFNLHVDWRPDEDGRRYKPLTKILVAAEFRANIVVAKESRVFELLPEDYPFAAADDLGSALARAESLFHTPEWERALAAMERIRTEFSFENHVKRFSRILQALG